jgi:hypothetical protein
MCITVRPKFTVYTKNLTIPVETFYFKKMSFLAELQPGIIRFIGITNSCNMPGASFKIIHQIRSEGFLVI